MTNCPSRKCTCLMVLLTCGRTSTLVRETTLPVALSSTGQSRFWARARVTDTVGALAELAAALAPPVAPLAAVAGATSVLSPHPVRDAKTIQPATASNKGLVFMILLCLVGPGPIHF